EHVFNRSAARTNAPQHLGQAAAVAYDEWGDKVATADHLKMAMSVGDVSPAPVSELQMSLVELARSMPTQPNDRIAHLDHARRITVEHDAAVYLRQAAQRVRQVRHDRSK